MSEINWLSIGISAFIGITIAFFRPAFDDRLKNFWLQRRLNSETKSKTRSLRRFEELTKLKNNDAYFKSQILINAGASTVIYMGLVLAALGFGASYISGYLDGLGRKWESWALLSASWLFLIQGVLLFFVPIVRGLDQTKLGTTLEQYEKYRQRLYEQWPDEVVMIEEFADKSKFISDSL